MGARASGGVRVGLRNKHATHEEHVCAIPMRQYRGCCIIFFEIVTPATGYATRFIVAKKSICDAKKICTPTHIHTHTHESGSSRSAAPWRCPPRRCGPRRRPRGCPRHGGPTICARAATTPGSRAPSAFAGPPPRRKSTRAPWAGPVGVRASPPWGGRCTWAPRSYPRWRRASTSRRTCDGVGLGSASPWWTGTC